MVAISEKCPKFAMKGLHKEDAQRWLVSPAPSGQLALGSDLPRAALRWAKLFKPVGLKTTEMTSPAGFGLVHQEKKTRSSA